MIKINKNNGFINAPIPIRSYDYNLIKPSGNVFKSFPEEYILPNQFIPPIHNQYDIGACVSFSMCECAESEALKNNEIVTYAKGWNYGRKESRETYRGYGLYADQALKGCVKAGFLPIQYFPDLVEVPEIIDLANKRDDLLQISKKPSGYANLSYALEDKKWEAIQQALVIDNTTLVIISHDYFRGGSHAVLGIGYTNKNGRHVIIQNSWGETWNKNGRDEIPIDMIDGVYVILWDKIELPFNDVFSTDWFYDDVKSAYLSNLVKGTTEITFEPHSSFKRGDFAIILSRTISKFEYSINSFIKTLKQQGKNVKEISFKKMEDIPFKDISPTDYYAEAICHIYANNIVNGITETEFAPEAFLTRAEVSAICIRFINKIHSMLKEATGFNFVLPQKEYKTFSDVDENEWYAPYIQKAYEIGIMQGNEDNTFAPNEEITRAEGAAILNRLFKIVDFLMLQTV